MNRVGRTLQHDKGQSRVRLPFLLEGDWLRRCLSPSTGWISQASDRHQEKLQVLVATVM